MGRGRAMVIGCVALLASAVGCGGPPSRLTTGAPAASPRRLRPPRLPVPTGRRPTTADPLRVLLVGDGVMFDAAPGIEAALGAAGPTVVTAAPVFGFGLTRPEVY